QLRANLLGRCRRGAKRLRNINWTPTNAKSKILIVPGLSRLFGCEGMAFVGIFTSKLSTALAITARAMARCPCYAKGLLKT
ncbi:MAG: hypothetical protein NOF05_07185, partial [Candidatus Accumulibacter phosphatis]|nr:hypothetical protein [Candidatus Accumulibacter phosphatis]